MYFEGFDLGCHPRLQPPLALLTLFYGVPKDSLKVDSLHVNSLLQSLSESRGKVAEIRETRHSEQPLAERVKRQSSPGIRGRNTVSALAVAPIPPARIAGVFIQPTTRGCNGSRNGVIVFDFYARAKEQRVFGRVTTPTRGGRRGRTLLFEMHAGDDNVRALVINVTAHGPHPSAATDPPRSLFHATPAHCQRCSLSLPTYN